MLVWLVPLALLIPVAWIDLRTHEVPDLFPVLLLVWLVATRVLDLAPTSTGAVLLGCAAALVPTVVLWHLGGLGGGDVKLLVPLGGLAAWPDVLTLLAGTAVAGGLLAAVLILRRDEPTPAGTEGPTGEPAGATDGPTRELAYVPAIAAGWALLGLLRWEPWS